MTTSDDPAPEPRFGCVGSLGAPPADRLTSPPVRTRPGADLFGSASTIVATLP